MLLVRHDKCQPVFRSLFPEFIVRTRATPGEAFQNALVATPYALRSHGAIKSDQT
jgi:hypothetical protein